MIELTAVEPGYIRGRNRVEPGYLRERIGQFVNASFAAIAVGFVGGAQAQTPQPDPHLDLIQRLAGEAVTQCIDWIEAGSGAAEVQFEGWDVLHPYQDFDPSVSATIEGIDPEHAARITQWFETLFERHPSGRPDQFGAFQWGGTSATVILYRHGEDVVCASRGFRYYGDSPTAIRTEIDRGRIVRAEIPAEGGGVIITASALCVGAGGHANSATVQTYPPIYTFSFQAGPSFPLPEGIC